MRKRRKPQRMVVSRSIPDYFLVQFQERGKPIKHRPYHSEKVHLSFTVPAVDMQAAIEEAYQLLGQYITHGNRTKFRLIRAECN